MMASFLEWTSQKTLISSGLGGRLGKIVNHILHCVLIFVTESEYYSYNDWADFLGTMELAAAAVTLVHWAMNYT